MLLNSNKHPSVSIAIPTLNEYKTIASVLNVFLNTNYPNLVEIFVADADSTDGTREIVEAIAEQDSRVKLIQNPQKIQSAALNLILEQCTGDIFLRADAHSDYAYDYIERSVEALFESNAIDAGGAQRFVAKTPFQAGVALAAKTFFGSGGAKYRDPNYDGYADTVFLGCFWKQKLLDMGGFSVARNEDGELSLRMLQESPTAIYVSSKIKVWYYPRATWKRLWRQYIKYGRGRCLTHIRHPDKFHLRSRIPVFFIPGVLTFLLLFITSYLLNLGWFIYSLFILILLFPILESARVTVHSINKFNDEIWRGDINESPSVLKRFFYCLVAMITMPTAYNVGYVYQFIQMKILNKEQAVFFE